MKGVAVVAHQAKTLDGGLPELRRELAVYGITDPDWHEVPKSKKAPKQVRKAIKNGAELVIVWGGDGMVQRCVDVLAGTDTTLAIIPAGTANLLATNLGIPKDLKAAVAHRRRRASPPARRRPDQRRGLRGDGRRRLRRPHDRRRRRRAEGPLRAPRVRLDRRPQPSARSPSAPASTSTAGSGSGGEASCILVGNVGQLFGGVEAFENARPDDGVVRARRGHRARRRRVAADDRPRRRSTAPPRRRTRRRPRRGRSGSGSTARCRTSWTAAIARRSRDIRIRLEPGAVRICVPGEAAAVA